MNGSFVQKDGPEMQATQESYYRLYGLAVRSQVPLPEGVPVGAGTTPDVEVRHGMPDAVVQAEVDAARRENRVGIGKLEDNTLWLDLPPGVFQIRRGNEIVVAPKDDADPILLRTFLLGSAFGFLMHQRGWYPVHGGAVLSGGQALILTGQRGAGKSTLTSALVEKGFPFLADDVSAVRITAGRSMVQPAYPQRKLCRDAATALGHNPDTLLLLNEEREKHALRDMERWHAQPAPLRWMVELVAEEGAALSVEPVTGHASLQMFMRNLYRSYYYHLEPMTPERMKEVLHTVSAALFYRLTHPAILATMESVTAALLTILEGG